MNKSLRFIFFIFITCLACVQTIPALDGGELGVRPETRVLTIQEAIRLALDHSPEIPLAEAQAARASEAIRETRSLNRPQLVAGTGLAYNNGYPLSMEGSAPSIFQIALSQSIFNKKNNNLIREAEEAGKASRLGIESARNELASKVALAYYALHQARKYEPLAAARLEAVQKQQKLMEALHEEGRARPVDLTLARNAVSAAEQQLVNAQEQARIAEVEIKNMAGLAAGIAIATEEPRIDSGVLGSQAETLFRQASEGAPEIRQAEASVRAKEFGVEAAKGEGRPQMDIISQYALFSRTNNYDDFFNRFTRNNYIIGLSIQVPLFNGHRTSAKVAQSRQEVTEANLRLQQMKSALKMGIERNLSALRIAKGASDLARNDIQAMQELVQASEALLEGGRISPKELDDLRSQWSQKELAQLDAEQTLFQRKVELLRLIGSAPFAFAAGK